MAPGIRSKLNSIKESAFNNAGLILLFISFIGTYVILFIPSLQTAVMEPLVISNIYQGLFTSTSLYTIRFFNILMYKYLFLIFGLNSDAFSYFIFIIHLLNAMFLYVLARKLKATQIQASFAAIIFVSNPLLLMWTYQISFLLSFPLTTAFLGITICYAKRKESKTWKKMCFWFAVEVVCSFIGMGFKESFIIYPGFLFSYELFDFFSRGEKFSIRIFYGIVKRMSPHIPVYFFWLYFHPVFEKILFYKTNESYLMSFDLVHLLKRLDTFMMKILIYGDDIGFPSGTGLAFIMILLIFAVILRKTAPMFLYGFLSMTIFLLPVLSFRDRFIEVYTYRPWTGLSLIIASQFRKTGKQRNLYIAATLLLAYIFMQCYNLPAITEYKYAAGFNESHITLARTRNALSSVEDKICNTKPVIWNVPWKLWSQVCYIHPDCDLFSATKMSQDDILIVMPEFKILPVICKTSEVTINLMPE